MYHSIGFQIKILNPCICDLRGHVEIGACQKRCRVPSIKSADTCSAGQRSQISRQIAGYVTDRSIWYGGV